MHESIYRARPIDSELERRERIERQMSHLLSFRHRHGNWIFVKSSPLSFYLSLDSQTTFNRAPCLLAQTDSYCFLLICDRSHVRPNSPLDESVRIVSKTCSSLRAIHVFDRNVIRAEGNRDEMKSATGAGHRPPKRVLESSKRITTIRQGNEEQVHHPRRPITRGEGEEFSGVLASALCLQDRYFLSISSVTSVCDHVEYRHN